MKKQIILLLIFFKVLISNGQTWNEWFRQDETALIRLSEQNLTWRLYGNSLTRGYKVLDRGILKIAGIGRSDQDVHRIRMDLLSEFSASLNSMYPLQFVSKQLALVTISARQLLREADTSSVLTSPEKSYVRITVNKILNSQNQLLEAILILLQKKSFSMEDEKRVRTLQKITDDIIGTSEYFGAFSTSVKLMVMQRRVEKTEINYSKAIH